MKIAELFRYFNTNLFYIFSNREFILEQKEFDESWQKNINNSNNPRFVAILNAIENHSSVLDLGCGNGDLMAEIKRSKDPMRLIGFDASKTGIDKCREKGLTASICNLHQLEPAQIANFDYIILSEVIEHIVDCEAIIKKLKNKYSKNLIITIPNAGYIWYRLRYLFGRFPIDENEPLNMHIRFWTHKDFLIWAGQLGFGVVKKAGTGGFPILWKYWPSLFSRNNLYVLK